MDRLERALAVGVLDVLLERAHVVVAPSRREALCDELEAIIVPALGWLEPYLAEPAAGPLTTKQKARKKARRDAGARRGRDAVDSSWSWCDGRARELMMQLTTQVAERLLESDHVDDIFSSDGVIQRDAERALSELLAGYVRGDLAVKRLDDEDAVFVPLLSLGYLVAEVSRRLELDMLRDALERAAATMEGRLVNLTRDRIAHFHLLGGAEAGRLALEESITHELVSLIEAELVELPTVERVLELPEECSDVELDTAFARALIRTRDHYDCAVQYVLVNACTFIATLTPLSTHSAEHQEPAFAMFVEALEEELLSPSRAPDSAKLSAELAAPSSRQPASSTRKKKGEAPPQSRPRGRRQAPRAQASSTRQLAEPTPNKRVK